MMPASSPPFHLSPAQEAAMTNEPEVVQADAVTKDLLKALLDAAYMNVSIDEDGDVMVKDTFRFWVIPAENGRWVRMFAQFKGNPEATMGAKLEYVNTVNRDLHVVRAYLRDNGGFTFDQYIPVEGGVSRRSIVFAVRGFDSLLKSALDLDVGNVVG
jgi:hypothetical protein